MAEVSERELFSALLNSLAVSRDACRGLALKRQDEHWLRLARIFDEVKDKATHQMNRKQSRSHSGLWVPPMAS